MRNNLSIKELALNVSAVLAVLYVLVMIASLLLVGLFTDGSWQAVFLGIGWSTIVGFEIGLLGVVIAGFITTVVLVLTWNAVRRQVASRLENSTRPGLSVGTSVRSGAFKLLTVCLVLPALTMVMLRVLASVLSLGVEPGVPSSIVQGSEAVGQAVNMGSHINTAKRESEPSFTTDGRTMYFNCHNNDICVSRRIGTWEEANWTVPELVGAPISSEYEEVEPMINVTGDKLYFNSNRPDGPLKGIPFLSPLINFMEVVNTISVSNFGVSIFDGIGLGHIWVSYRTNSGWSEPRRLETVLGEPPVNSIFHDHCLSLSADGNEAFWTSTRPGGFGGNDIWTSRRVDGEWTVPENLGPNVNGAGDEHHSNPTSDGTSLYVTAVHDGGYGGEDIYITIRGLEGKWGPLINLGPLVNGPGDDRCAAWTPDGNIFIFDSVREVGFGGRDIWWVYFKVVKGNQSVGR